MNNPSTMEPVSTTAILDEYDLAYKSMGISQKKREQYLNVLRDLNPIKGDYTPRDRITPYAKADLTFQKGHKKEFKIPECNGAYRCNYACCKVDESGDNTIDLHPGELANATPESVLHLSDANPSDTLPALTIIQKNTSSGCQVNCKFEHKVGGINGCGPRVASDGTIIQKEGRKPDDCDNYPAFPYLEDGKIAVMQAIEKCPLPPVPFLRHLAVVLNNFEKTLIDHPETHAHFAQAHLAMSGYRKYDLRKIEVFTADDLHNIFEAHKTVEKNRERIRVDTNNARESRTVTHGTLEKQTAAVKSYTDAIAQANSRAMAIIVERGGLHFRDREYGEVTK